jgi:Flp pilus assembly protein TadD
VPSARQPAADRDRFAQAAAEFVAAQKLNADRPEARTALGSFFARQANPEGAEIEYRAALRLDPSFAAAAVNLSDLYRQLGRDVDGERVLRAALSGSAQDAPLHHALGLALARQKRNEAALDELRQAAVLDPGHARYAYVYAIALKSAGQRDDALAVLKESLRAHPNNLELLSAAINFSREKGDVVTALEYAQRLARLMPNDPGLADLIGQLKR